MKIKEMLSKNTNYYSGVNPCNFITIHETGNTSATANALSHANFMNNGSTATYHYVVDDKEVIQLFKDTVKCWHAGDGLGRGNTESIGIEMCINAGGDMLKTIDNTVELVKHLMSKHNISIENVVPHKHWSGKSCPNNLLNSKPITWTQFINKIKTNPIVSDNKGKLYKVQVGAFKDKTNAEKLSKELESKGYKNLIVES